jgi:hypothetical protein
MNIGEVLPLFQKNLNFGRGGKIECMIDSYTNSLITIGSSKAKPMIVELITLP